MNIAGTLSCSLINGEGVRYVVFLQGCPHHCDGCHNPDTWDFNGGQYIHPAELAADIRKHRLIDGITVSGGEPFAQEDECLRLLEWLPDNTNVWVYTGYEYAEVKDRPLGQRANVLVTGKYVKELKCEGKMYGSSNQEIHRKEVE